MKRGIGFTLIELLTVLAIVGLLSSLAMPSFQGIQQRTQRAMAKVALLQSAQWLERAASTQGSYPSTLPDAVWQKPDARYRLQLQSDGHAYLLKAVPTGSQISDPCATLTLNQAGERGVQGARLSTVACWSP